MKFKHLLVLVILVSGLCSCGSSSKTTAENSDGATAAVTDLVMDTDPVVIELENFEGRRLSGERCYIVLYDSKIKAQIPTAAGMVRSGMATSTYALTFNQGHASISKPNADKKGRSYSFNVVAQDGQFFSHNSLANWRFSITIKKDGIANVYVESDDIAHARGTRTWWFTGYVNKSRTDALKMIKASDPFSGFPNE